MVGAQGYTPVNNIKYIKEYYNSYKKIKRFWDKKSDIFSEFEINQIIKILKDTNIGIKSLSHKDDYITNYNMDHLRILVNSKFFWKNVFVPE
jgi:hypothetical protein